MSKSQIFKNFSGALTKSPSFTNLTKLNSNKHEEFKSVIKIGEVIVEESTTQMRITPPNGKEILIPKVAEESHKSNNHHGFLNTAYYLLALGAISLTGAKSITDGTAEDKAWHFARYFFPPEAKPTKDFIHPNLRFCPKGDDALITTNLANGLSLFQYKGTAGAGKRDAARQKMEAIHKTIKEKCSDPDIKKLWLFFSGKSKEEFRASVIENVLSNKDFLPEKSPLRAIITDLSQNGDEELAFTHYDWEDFENTGLIKTTIETKLKKDYAYELAAEYLIRFAPRYDGFQSLTTCMAPDVVEDFEKIAKGVAQNCMTRYSAMHVTSGLIGDLNINNYGCTNLNFESIDLGKSLTSRDVEEYFKNHDLGELSVSLANKIFKITQANPRQLDLVIKYFQKNSENNKALSDKVLDYEKLINNKITQLMQQNECEYNFEGITTEQSKDALLPTAILKLSLDAIRHDKNTGETAKIIFKRLVEKCEKHTCNYTLMDDLKKEQTKNGVTERQFYNACKLLDGYGLISEVEGPNKNNGTEIRLYLKVLDASIDRQRALEWVGAKKRPPSPSLETPNQKGSFQTAVSVVRTITGYPQI